MTLEKLKLLIKPYLDRNTDECILYPYLNKDGYGDIQFYHLGKKCHLRAHRLVYSVYHNIQLHRDNIIMHTCDNPACCNYKHLKLGTHNDNVQDKVNKDRQAKGKDNGRYTNGYYSKYVKVDKPAPEFTTLYGRTLTKEVVLQIKEAIANKNGRTLQTISTEFNVPLQKIKDISAGRAYKNV